MSLYKLGDVIKGIGKKRFIVVKDPGIRFFCEFCVFCVESNPAYDIHVNCRDRRYSWFSDRETLDKRCDELIPSGCIFKEIKDGGV